MGRWSETGISRENHLTHPQLGLSHMWPVRGSNLHKTQRWDDRMIKSAEIQRPYPLGHGGRPKMGFEEILITYSVNVGL